jgi:hypothetical protein
MKTLYEVGDRVKVTSLREFGICYTNKHGGTSEFPKGSTMTCSITEAWGDYEIGRRYIGKTDKGQDIYFGEFGVKIISA